MIENFLLAREAVNEKGERASAVSFFEGVRRSFEWNVSFIATAEDKKGANTDKNCFRARCKDYSENKSESLRTGKLLSLARKYSEWRNGSRFRTGNNGLG